MGRKRSCRPLKKLYDVHILVEIALDVGCRRETVIMIMIGIMIVDTT